MPSLVMLFGQYTFGNDDLSIEKPFSFMCKQTWVTLMGDNPRADP